MAKKRPRHKSSKTKQNASEKPLSNSINDVAIAAVLNSQVHQTSQPVLVKVCRLCEARDGPFLNIFDADKVTAKKIEELMPFRIAENDDLPHKICFRCSAKVEELYEFIQKCIRTQESLNTTMGKNEPIAMKSKTRTMWEKTLIKTNLSNDIICDALIKQAMEGIKDTPLKPVEEQHPVKNTKPIEEPPVKRSSRAPKIETKTAPSSSDEEDNSDEVNLKQVKIAIKKCDEKPPPTKKAKIDTKAKVDTKTENSKDPPVTKPIVPTKKVEKKEVETIEIKDDIEEMQTTASFSLHADEIMNKIEKSKVETDAQKPFNIMDHVCTIRVNGVGILFQCKLCNRNFLKKEVVESHGCAKNNIPKDNISKNTTPVPGPPKPSTVKYITMDKNLKLKEHSTVITDAKVKPKVGPASKVKKDLPPVEPPAVPQEPPAAMPTVNVPLIPRVNNLFKLIPGPNNTFTLIEDQTQKEQIQPIAEPQVEYTKTPEQQTDFPNMQALSAQKPYPVGLFQTPHHSKSFPPTPPPMFVGSGKKQNYTVIQTGNPSKLLISSKPQVPSEPVKKKVKKSEIAEQQKNTDPAKNFVPFTFVSLDSTQPSYVLPTNNIIQESQITTSTPVAKAVEDNDSYGCNMCGEKFTREKKLLAHIQSHYTKMDEEDQMRVDKHSKKRSRKS